MPRRLLSLLWISVHTPTSTTLVKMEAVMPRITFHDDPSKSDAILPTPTRPRAYYAHLYDQPGILAQINGVLYFVSEEGRVTKFQPEMTNWCTTLGAVVPSEMQRIHDRINGGAWKIACDRPMGRR